MSETLQLDLDVVLPHAHDERDRCVADLMTALDRLDGVSSVHVIDAEPAGATVCLHLQPGSVALPVLEERVRAVGAQVEDRYGHLLMESVPAGHGIRANSLTERLRALPGVVDAAVSIEGIVRIEFERDKTSEARLRAQLPSIGVVPSVVETRDLAPDHEGVDHDHGGHGHTHGHGARTSELIAAFVSLALYVVARSLDWFTNIGGPVTGLYIAAALITGVFVAQDALLSVRARVFDIDQLMLVAAIGAASIGHWSDSALLLVLFSLGHALEGYAMNRARTAIESLAELAPATARRRGEPDVEVPVERLRIGDVVLVRPDERLPADGFVVAGNASIDESAVTGESVPVDKEPLAEGTAVTAEFDRTAARHRVYAGTLNGSTAIEVLVRKTSADSTLARVVQLVAEAETQISPSQRFTKKLVRVFVPAVLVLVVGLLIGGPALGESFRESFARAMAVLVAASPCALAIATPSAVLSAIARAARSGILIKGGGPLESLGDVSVMAFDKTGTLTEGKPVLTDVVPVPGRTEAELLTLTWAVERSSDHPLARAITVGAVERLGSAALDSEVDVQAVTSVHGKGITGRVAGSQVMIGNSALFDGIAIPESLRAEQQRLQQAGRTTTIVRRGSDFLGVLAVMDTPRDAATSTVSQLRAAGIQTIVMLSGDTQPVASAVGTVVGISDARGALLPAEKVAAVNQLGTGATVAMVGDGVNDAPALAAAHVGIAMGAAGSDIALETADIALMSDDIKLLPLAIRLSRRASSVIKQNLFFSLAVVAVLIPMTIAGIGISVAVIAHEGSTLVVVANALRLLRFADD